MRTTIPWLLAATLALSLPARTPAREDAPARRGEWSFDLVDEHGRPLPTFAHRGGTYVLGTAGQRYRVRVRNDSPRRVEVVVSVDGRDVIDGGPSSLEKHGYVVDAHGEAILDGYRLSESVVAVFRFGTVARSYAALEGDARDVGVIGVAVFPERRPRRVALPESAPLATPEPGALGRSRGLREGGASTRARHHLRRGARLAGSTGRLRPREFPSGGAPEAALRRPARVDRRGREPGTRPMRNRRRVAAPLRGSVPSRLRVRPAPEGLVAGGIVTSTP